MFGDGTAWNKADLQAAYLSQAQTAGNDTIYGFSGSTTFAVSALAGNDTIVDGVDLSAATDRLIFGAGLNAADLIIFRPTSDPDDAVLSFLGKAGSITLEEQFSGSYNSGLEQIVFGDGTAWTKADLQAAYIARAQTAGNDIIYSFDGANTFTVNALAGDDRIVEGYAPSDIDKLVFGTGLDDDNLIVTRSTSDLDDMILGFRGLSGSITLDEQDSTSGYGLEQIVFSDGTIWTKANLQAAYIAQAQTAGNDTIYGFAGATTFVVDRLAGDDTIVEDRAPNDTDTLVFGAAFDAADLIVTRSAGNVIGMTLGFRGQIGSITLDHQDSTTGGFGFEQIVFGDGATWTRADLLAAYIAQAQTAGNDTIYGFSGATTFVINQLAGYDSIVEGFAPNDTDKLVFGTGFNVADLIIVRPASDPYNVVLSFQGHAGSITLDGQFSASGEGIEQIVFGDGTAWTKADLRTAYQMRAITAGNDTIFGFVDADSLDGAGGDDSMDGLSGDDTLLGGAGGDVLHGSDGNDTLTGGTGTDTLRGGWKSDTYIYALGDGSDTIIDGVSTADSDTLSLAVGIAQGDVLLSRSSSDVDDLVIRFAGSQGSIVIDGQLLANGSGVERILFADGSSWSAAEIASRLLSQAGTPDDEQIIGTAFADAIRGAGGNDTINGKGGGDTYLYGLGDGDDLITEESSTGTSDIDRLVLGAGIDSDAAIVTRPSSGNIDDLILGFDDNSGSVTLRRQIWGSGYGIEQVVFADGTVWTADDLKIKYLQAAGTAGDDTILAFDERDDTVNAGAGMDYVYGMGGNDVISGGAGRDFLYGNTGSDVYLYSIGCEDDVIIDLSSTTTDVDVLRFGPDLKVADIIVTSFSSTSTTATISFAGYDGEITLYNQFLSGPGEGIERFEFSDGTTWTNDDLRQFFLNHLGNSGPDTLTGTAGDDVLDGGPGVRYARRPRRGRSAHRWRGLRHRDLRRELGRCDCQLGGRDR